MTFNVNEKRIKDVVDRLAFIAPSSFTEAKQPTINQPPSLKHNIAFTPITINCLLVEVTK